MLLSGDDIVAIFDNDDGTRPPGISSTPAFEEAADDYPNPIGAPDWDTVVAALEQYVQDHGLIDVLYIFGAYTGTNRTNRSPPSR